MVVAIDNQPAALWLATASDIDECETQVVMMVMKS
jgi:hypothetical protein